MLSVAASAFANTAKRLPLEPRIPDPELYRSIHAGVVRANAGVRQVINLSLEAPGVLSLLEMVETKSRTRGEVHRRGVTRRYLPLVEKTSPPSAATNGTQCVPRVKFHFMIRGVSPPV